MTRFIPTLRMVVVAMCVWMYIVAFTRFHAESIMKIPYQQQHSRSVSIRRNLTRVEEFWEILKEPTGSCVKLVNFGGVVCHDKKDGDKDVCLDVDLWPKERHTRCLVYSFGIGYDISFENMLYYYRNCELHLFDPSIDPTFIQDIMDLPSTWTYHNIGLFHQNKVENINNYSIKFETLDRIMNNLGHSDQTIHYLKADIEHFEWDVLLYALDHKLLDSVNQISMELHLYRLNTISRDQWIEFLQIRLNLLYELEENGFRRISYRDNYSKGCLLEVPGLDKPITGCGEVLYARVPSIA